MLSNLRSELASFIEFVSSLRRPSFDPDPPSGRSSNLGNVFDFVLTKKNEKISCFVRGLISFYLYRS